MNASPHMSDNTSAGTEFFSDSTLSPTLNQLPHEDSSLAAGAITVPPIAEKRPGKLRSFHGHTFIDPWEWLRDKEDADVLAHVRAENAWTDAVCAPTVGLQKKIREEMAAYTNETDVSVPERIGDFWYIKRTREGQSYGAHYRIPVSAVTEELPPVLDPLAITPNEQLLIDEAALAQGQDFFRLACLSPSPDGRLLAWLRDINGDERWDIVVQNASTGDIVDESVLAAGYGLAWSADSHALIYTRVDEAWRQYQVWVHHLGSDPASDSLILEECDETFEVTVSSSRDPRWICVHAFATDTSEGWLVSTAAPEGPVIPITGRTDGVLAEIEPAGDQVLVVHTATSIEGTLSVAAIPEAVAGKALTKPLAPPESWVPIREAREGERLLSVEAYGGFCVLSLRAQGQTEIEYRLRTTPPHADMKISSAVAAEMWGEGHLVESDYPVRTLTSLPGSRFLDSKFCVAVESLIHPPQVFAIDPWDGGKILLKSVESPGWNPEEFVEERVWVTARDEETQIPVSLVHRVDSQPDGTGNAWLYGYGSYEISIDPEFSTTRLPLLSRGIAFAIAHVRGGGEMGRYWYEDGRRERKVHTFTDFIDVAHWLHDSGWAKSDGLIAEGRSAGGLLMGAIANMAPDQFRVVLAGVPFVDALTTILDPSLPLTAGEWSEWGNPIEDAKIYEIMSSYSPYENVHDGTLYPAIMATTSLNDTRVFYVEPAKWIQRLREAATNDPHARPILLRTEMVAGHGGRSGRYELWAARAEEFAFALSQIGVSD